MVEDLFQQALVPAFVEGPGEADGLGDRHPAVERMTFGQVGDPGAGFRAQLGGLFAEERGAAVAGLRHAQKHADRGRLACPVTAEESVDGPLGNAEVQGVDGAVFAEVFGEVLSDDDVGHGYESFSRH